jgi:circadian clock protein KaiB
MMRSQATDVPFTADPSGEDDRIQLRLYVTGASRRSLCAIANIQSICREYLDEHHTDLQIIDLYATPSSARADHIVVAPTLIKELPAPRCRIIGDLSEKERVVHSLGLHHSS